MPSQEQTKIESTRIAKQMISEYKEKYGATSHSSTGKGTSKPQITTEELDGLTKTRKLSKINKANKTYCNGGYVDGWNKTDIVFILNIAILTFLFFLFL